MFFRTMLILLSTFLLLIGTARARTQAGFTMPAWTVASGGTTLSAASYTFFATAGQPDVGLLQGGVYALSGGFFPGAAASGKTQTALFLPAVTAGAATRVQATASEAQTPQIWLPRVTSP